MGFNKRFIDKNKILSNIDNILNLLKSDAIITTDKWSSLFLDDLDKNQRKLRIELIEDTKFNSGIEYQNHKNFYLLNSLSEAFINLHTNPTWIDIHLVFIKTKFNIEESKKGNFKEVINIAKDAIISYYDDISIKNNYINE